MSQNLGFANDVAITNDTVDLIGCAADFTLNNFMGQNN